MIVDAHCHAGKGDLLTGPWDTDASLGAYMRRARRAGIDRTIIFSAFHSNYAVANAQIARIVRSTPDRLIGFAFVHCTRDRGRIAELVGTAVTRYGFRGIKAHARDARLTREACEAAARFNVPLLYDVGGQTDVVELLAPEYPSVQFIVPHLGSFSDDWRAHRRTIELMARCANVYTDTAGVRFFDFLVEAVNRVGPRRIIFGSDGPWLHPALELAKIRLLGLNEADLALVLGGNILRLLRVHRFATDLTSIIKEA